MTATSTPDGGARVGLLLPSREVTLWADGDPTRLVDAAVAAEADRFDSVWVGESLLARPRPEPLTTLAAIAARTDRIQIGTAVLLPLLRHPLTLAHALATLDRLCHGRLVIGLGPGAEVTGTHAELAAVGVSPDRRVAVLRATVSRWRQAWSDQDPASPPLGSDSAAWQVRPLPTTPQGPPLWLAANGPRMLKLTGRDYAGWLPFIPTAADYRRAAATVRRAAEAAGRDPDQPVFAAYLTVAIDDNPRTAATALREYMSDYYGASAPEVVRSVSLIQG